jgi:hypothetical protein
VTSMPARWRRRTAATLVVRLVVPVNAGGHTRVPDPRDTSMHYEASMMGAADVDFPRSLGS